MSFITNADPSARGIARKARSAAKRSVAARGLEVKARSAGRAIILFMKEENNLSRFISAQETVYPQVMKELKAGRKTSHWMWYIFPQIAGLGMSPTAKFYSIMSISEAKEYLAHPVLGKRLVECCNIILSIKDRSAEAIFGYPDFMKLQSCVTLFNFIDADQKAFSQVLHKYYKDIRDQKTFEILENMRLKDERKD